MVSRASWPTWTTRPPDARRISAYVPGWEPSAFNSVFLRVQLSEIGVPKPPQSGHRLFGQSASAGAGHGFINVSRVGEADENSGHLGLHQSKTNRGLGKTFHAAADQEFDLLSALKIESIVGAG